MIKVIGLLSVFLIAWPQHSMAQTGDDIGSSILEGEQIETVEVVELEDVDEASEDMITPDMTPVDLDKAIDPDDLASLFFTFWEHNAIRDAKRARGLARPPTESEILLPEEEEIERIQPEPGSREIALGGIAYTSTNDWTIWLNGKRVTPNALPREIVELRVYDDYIELKWLDDYTRQIFPIRLRAHQRFDLDSRIFLPG